MEILLKRLQLGKILELILRRLQKYHLQWQWQLKNILKVNFFYQISSIYTRLAIDAKAATTYVPAAQLRASLDWISSL